MIKQNIFKNLSQTSFFLKMRRIFSKTYAISEKNIKMQLRFKYSLIVGYITPILSILMPFFIFGKLFENSIDIDPWNAHNAPIFILISYNILLMRRMVVNIPSRLNEEKFWKTITALIVAPFNRFYLLIGYFISEFFIMVFPFVIISVILFIFWPISIMTALIIILMYISIALIFCGISLIVGAFALTNENIWGILRFSISFIFIVSCVSYPFQMYPGIAQEVIKYNPIYYIIDILRLTWIENSIIDTITLHPFHFIVYFSSIFIFPIVGVYLFNYIFKKLGIQGY